ncbi:MAG: SPFH domain-containing protein [Cyanophyceae cyanobacterium]
MIARCGSVWGDRFIPFKIFLLTPAPMFFFKTFYIKPTERGLLFRRSDFKQILNPGIHRFIGRRWNVQVFDVQESRLTLRNLEFLLQEHGDAFSEHCEIVRTGYNEAALVKTPLQWYVVERDETAAFWRGWNRANPVTVHRFNLDDTLEISTNLVSQIQHRQGLSPAIQFVNVQEDEVELLYRDGNFLQLLTPGRYAFWNVNQELHMQRSRRLGGILTVKDTENLIDNHPEFVEEYCEIATLSETEIAIVRDQGNVIDILPPGSRRLFWKGVTIEAINTQDQPQLTDRQIKELILGRDPVKRMAMSLVTAIEVAPQHVGLFYESGTLAETLEPGWHSWWSVGRSMKTEVVDLRLQVLEVSGQEILTKDKVALRLNLTTGYRITDPNLALSSLKNVQEYLYKELQFALRGAIGTKTLDELLEDKGAIDGEVLQYIQPKAEEYGVAIASVGVKDIILPGEMKTILAQVVEAEKSAQANVIRRREETAATRSMLNTARVMENNPMAMRLKEMEVLERIAEKVNGIEVRGSLNNLLSDLVSLQDSQ